MRDGIGQMGAGQDDRRVAGEDLQHYTQKRTADENPTGQKRMVRQEAGGGGPMKEHMEHDHGHHHPMHHHLEVEKQRHEESHAHQMHHLEKHHSRHFDSQHGHDTFHHKGHHHE